MSESVDPALIFLDLGYRTRFGNRFSFNVIIIEEYFAVIIIRRIVLPRLIINAEMFTEILKYSEYDSLEKSPETLLFFNTSDVYHLGQLPAVRI